jgi:DNA-binding Lrp family transcriptional regulator
VLLKVRSGAEREVCKKMSDFEEVLDTSIIYGEFDLIAKITARQLEELENFLFENIRSIPSIMVTSTMIVAREYKGKTKRNALKVNKI